MNVKAGKAKPPRKDKGYPFAGPPRDSLDFFKREIARHGEVERTRRRIEAIRERKATELVARECIRRAQVSPKHPRDGEGAVREAKRTKHDATTVVANGLHKVESRAPVTATTTSESKRRRAEDLVAQLAMLRAHKKALYEKLKGLVQGETPSTRPESSMHAPAPVSGRPAIIIPTGRIQTGSHLPQPPLRPTTADRPPPKPSPRSLALTSEGKPKIRLQARTGSHLTAIESHRTVTLPVDIPNMTESSALGVRKSFPRAAPLPPDPKPRMRQHVKPISVAHATEHHRLPSVLDQAPTSKPLVMMSENKSRLRHPIKPLAPVSASDQNGPAVDQAVSVSDTSAAASRAASSTV